MRFFTSSLLLGSLLLVLASGCQRASIQCQRETALLRAEILDLEDKYYTLKSQHERSTYAAPGTVVTDNVIGAGVVGSSWPVEGQVISGGVIGGDVIYEDQMANGVPVLQAPVEGEVYYDGQIYGGQTYGGQIYDGQVLPLAAPAIDSGVESIPVPTLADPAGSVDSDSEGSGDAMDLNLDNPPTSEPAMDDQSILLPDMSTGSDVPALEVGFEDLELDMSSDSEIDRVEIIPASTRGKDLDGVPGHDGIELMFKAVDSGGESVTKMGELTVTVSDNLVGEIGKWTFLPKELVLFQSRDESGNVGTLLHLPWSDRIPVSRQVEVRVSMLINRIQYVATQEVEIKPPTGQANNNAVTGWTASDDRWLSNRKSGFQNKQRSAFQNGSFQKGSFQNGSSTKAPATAVQRPQWKPVR